MITINSPDSTNSSYKVILSGASYTINQKYNTRTKSWYVDVKDSKGVYLVRGRKLQLNIPVVNINLQKMPNGNLTVLKRLGSKDKKITRDNLGADKDFFIVYYTSEEFLSAN